MSKQRIFSGPNFSVFGPEKTPYLDTFHAVWEIESSTGTCLFCRKKETKLWHCPSSMLLKKSILVLRFILVFFCCFSFVFFLFWIYIVFSFFADFFDRLSKQIFHKKNIWNFDELLNVKVAIIKKPVNWSALQTNWLVSIWWQLWRLMSQWIVWDLINNSSLLNPQILSDSLKNAITSLHLRIMIISCMK